MRATRRAVRAAAGLAAPAVLAVMTALALPAAAAPGAIAATAQQRTHDATAAPTRQRTHDATAATARQRIHVSIGPRRIVLTAPGVRVTVNRRPFTIAFATGVGRPVLRELRAAPAPAPLAPTTDPVPPGTDALHSGQLYAPLSFLVGTETLQQYAGGVWGGNLHSGTRSGVQYSARAVISAKRIRAGVRLTVSTDDPSGRTLRVVVRQTGTGIGQAGAGFGQAGTGIGQAGAGAVTVAVTAHPATGVAIMSDSFASPRNEAFYGFGGRHDALDQRGRTISSWVSEENLPDVPSDNPLAAQLYPNGPTAAYYPQSQFVSSAGYGFMVPQSQLTRFRLDSDRANAWSVSVSATRLDYVVAPGGPQRALATLTALTGRQPAPPPWALGPMLDRGVKNFGETRRDYTANVFADLRNLRRYRIPITAYRLEGWGLASPSQDGLALHPEIAFATQRKVVAALRRRGIHVLAYLRPWIVPGSAPDRDGLTVRNSSRHTFLTTGTGGQPIALLDFTNPAAVRFWRRQVFKVLSLGFDGFMADFGEEVLAGMHFADGKTGATMHNRYPLLYMEATRRAVQDYERRHPKRRIWFFNRAGFTGSAAYEGGNFPGDEATDWGQASGLESSAPDMLNRAIDGAYGFGTDIGGYYDYTTPPTTKALFLRWAEWATLSPVFRLHGAGRTGTHTPWSFDAQTVRAYRALSLLHERAVPLIMRLWRAADRTGVPPTRPLWLQYPHDRAAAAEQQEWLLGNDVLVAPVVTEGALRRAVVFPPGCWRDPQTGLLVHGPRAAAVAAPLTRLPFFFRCGTKPFDAAGRAAGRHRDRGRAPAGRRAA